MDYESFLYCMEDKMTMEKKFTKKQWGVLAGACTLVIIFVAVVCFVFFFNPQRTFNITETYRITSTDDSETFLRVTLPMSGAYQEIIDLQVKGALDYEMEYFNGWRELTARVPSNGSEAIITISYTARLFRNVRTWDGEVRPEYTLPQQFIDSDNEAIIELAAQLRSNNNLQTARNIHDHVNELISWPSDQQINVARLYASELLESPVGVCGDFANLMTALLRAESIPTRTISGLALNVPLRRANDWNHQGGAHSWVEFYADGKWHFADPSWGWFNRNATAHLSFGTFNAYICSDFQQNRLTAIENDGFFITGAMSTPLSFTVFSTYENTTVIPRADVSFSWFR